MQENLEYYNHYAHDVTSLEKELKQQKYSGFCFFREKPCSWHHESNNYLLKLLINIIFQQVLSSLFVTIYHPLSLLKLNPSGKQVMFC